MTCPGMRANRDPDPAALAVVAIMLIVAVLLANALTGCHSAPDRRVRDVPAWTNAAPYEGARGPSW